MKTKKLPLFRISFATCIVALLCVFTATFAAAQDDAKPPAEGEIVGSAGVTADLKDPSDEVVEHIIAMTDIVKGNLDKPADAKSKLADYIEKNQESMNAAGERFEARLNEMEPDERVAYQEKLQRKMEAPLAAFLKVMLDFSERHPDAAKELDEMLQAAEKK